MRVFAFALLAVSSVTASVIPIPERHGVSHNRPCEAGKPFKIYCNTCACGDDGFSVSCTRMECPEGVYNEDGSLKSPGQVSTDSPVGESEEDVPSGPCEPGKSFKHYCNSCMCGNDGLTAGCTFMLCPRGFYNQDGSLKRPAALARETRQVNRRCEAGKQFEEYCNTCTCGSDGLSAVCTKMACPEGTYNQIRGLKDPGHALNNALMHRETRQVDDDSRISCEPGKPVNVYCNQCACGPDGFATKTCTRMACPEGMFNQDGTLKNPGESSKNALHRRQTRQVGLSVSCEPGKPVNVYCNKCACGPNGLATACTRMACPEGMYNQDGSLKNSGQSPNNALHRQTRQVDDDSRISCEPGKPVNVYCNQCACGPDGFATKACTRMACPEGMYNQDGTLKNPGQSTTISSLTPIGHCQPGKTFKHYCNTCMCGADGAVTACTLMLCDERVYNIDGSRKTPKPPVTGA